MPQFDLRGIKIGKYVNTSGVSPTLMHRRWAMQ